MEPIVVRHLFPENDELQNHDRFERGPLLKYKSQSSPCFLSLRSVRLQSGSESGSILVYGVVKKGVTFLAHPV
jgi:hypothetical protein